MAAILLLGFGAAPAAGETRALLIGVWEFESQAILNLKGPENDLAAMETLVRTEGATDVTVLRNDQVTRTTVETALHALGLRSKPGDWIILYYSGHGAQAEAAVKGTSDGDLDQFLPLARFDPDQQDPERFIVDKDFYEWFSRYVPDTVQVLMIADTCHSGSMNRAVDTRAFHFTPRMAMRAIASELQLVARPAPRFPSVLVGAATRSLSGPVDRADLPNLFFIGAAQDGQLALETSLPVENAPPRGLLTFSIEQGLTQRGADGKTLLADLDGDGKVAASELAVYVDAQVRALSGQRQQPRSAFFAGRETAQLFAAAPPLMPVAPVKPALPSIFVADPKGRALLSGAEVPWSIAASGDAADFVLDYGKRTLIRRSGDAVAEGVTTTAALRGIVEKWNTIEALRPLINESNGKLNVGPQANGMRYRAGAKVALAYENGGAGGYVTVFNLASDGTVQLLYPIDENDGDGRLTPSGALPLFDNRVVQPFGVDHVIAVVNPTIPADFRAKLRTLDNQRASGQTIPAIRSLLATSPGKATLSIAELYTGP